MVDVARLRRLISSLERWRDVLAERQPDIYRRRYAVQSAAQATIDIANHVIASEGWRVPNDYGDAFTVLAEHGIISDALAARLRGLAGLRSVLVYAYDQIDDERVAREAVAGSDDFAAFVAAITALIDTSDD